jgi:pimeloyl-ACP methyl ester carboxylesterase
MGTKSVQVNSLSIAYRESSGKGAPVLLVHGNSASSRIFQPQLESALGEKHHLVAIDLPGHGESADASDPAATYHMPGYTEIVVNIAQQLGLEQAVVVGWSLGGHIALEAVSHLPQAAGFMIYGTPPLAFPPDMEQAFFANPAMGAAFQQSLTDAEADAFSLACFKPGATEIPQIFHEDIRRTDGQARVELAASIRPEGYTDEVVIIEQMTAPLAIVHGEHEQLVNLAYIQSLTMPTLWRGAVQVVGDAGHATNWERPEAFNALLEAFVNDCAGG